MHDCEWCTTVVEVADILFTSVAVPGMPSRIGWSSLLLTITWRMESRSICHLACVVLFYQNSAIIMAIRLSTQRVWHNQNDAIMTCRFKYLRTYAIPRWGWERGYESILPRPTNFTCNSLFLRSSNFKISTCRNKGSKLIMYAWLYWPAQSAWLRVYLISVCLPQKVAKITSPLVKEHGAKASILWASNQIENSRA